MSTPTVKEINERLESKNKKRRAVVHDILNVFRRIIGQRHEVTEVKDNPNVLSSFYFEHKPTNERLIVIGFVEGRKIRVKCFPASDLLDEHGLARYSITTPVYSKWWLLNKIDSPTQAALILRKKLTFRVVHLVNET